MHLLIIVHCSWFVAHRQLLTIGCLSSTAHNWLLIVNCSLFVNYHGLLTFNWHYIYAFSVKHCSATSTRLATTVAKFGEIGHSRTDMKIELPICSIPRCRCTKHLHPAVPWAALIYPKLCLTQKTSNWRAKCRYRMLKYVNRCLCWC